MTSSTLPSVRRHPRRWLAVVLAFVLVAVAFVSSATAPADAATGQQLVVLSADPTNGDDVEDAAANVRTLATTAGAAVVADWSDQIGVLLVDDVTATLLDSLVASADVEAVGADFTWPAMPTLDKALANGDLTLVDEDAAGGGEPSSDPLESLQWSMEQIRTEQAHANQAGSPLVDVGILDTGIDAAHADFLDVDGTNVDCARGHDSVVAVGPGVGSPAPCTDNNFHGTHVAGIVAARANGLGVVGVAPNVTLVPVKVCDASGHCYASSVVDGITYAGDQRLDVINMSFFVDDDELLESTEFKCSNDETQHTFRKAVERAVSYARNQGVTPVAALGNSDTDLAHPDDNPDADGKQCEVVPAETSGVVGTSSLGPDSGKASYSNWGNGPNDVAAPGGSGSTGDCATTVLSTLPGNSYGCIQGTSMASPHAAGVAALIVSQFGTAGDDGLRMSPTKVEQRLAGTSIDIGEPGYDECFGHGRIDAVRAIQHATARTVDGSAPDCPEYDE